jgi:hypothetical protein
MLCIRGINLEFNSNKVSRIGMDTLDVPVELSMGFKLSSAIQLEM